MKRHNIKEDPRLWNDHVTVSASGQASRMRPYLIEQGFPDGTPKSALLTGEGESLLGRVTKQSMEIGHPILYANYISAPFFRKAAGMPQDVTLEINVNIEGPLGPIYHDALRTHKQSYMIAADLWAEFSMEDFRKFHNSHDKPASILVGPSVPAKGGARFNVAKDGTVESWERVENTTEDDLINIGVYIMDGFDPRMVEVIDSLVSKTHKEDPFNDAMIEKGLLAAYVLPSLAFNANNKQVYEALKKYTKGRPTVPEFPSKNPINFITGPDIP